MKKIYILILVLLSVACSSDESIPKDETQDEPQENLPLGNFTVMTENITPFSAAVNWTIPENSENTNVVYAIYLDDILQQENIATTTFLLENLSSETDYTIKIEARNEISSVNSVTVFTTTEIPQLYATKITSASNSSVYTTITYRADKQIVEVLKFSPSINLDYSYTYNEQGKLTFYDGGDVFFGTTRASYTYSGNNIDEINANHGFSDARTNEDYNYAPDLTSYTYRRTFDDPGGVTIEEESENFITRDGQNRVVQHRKLNTTANTEKTYNFEYEDGNLIKITDAEGTYWEISYDNQQSFLTFYSGYRGGPAFPGGVRAGLQSLYDFNLEKDIERIPDFFGYRNNNNPLEIRKNGTIIGTFQYEYNEFEYPTKIIFEGGYTFEFEYTEL